MLIREASLSDAAAIARVHVDSWCTTYAGSEVAYGWPDLHELVQRLQFSDTLG